jgi:histidine triad (HIT) family protein
MAETIFDKILRREIPANVVYEDDDILAFNDISPQAKQHILVIPKKKARNLTELRDWDSQQVGVFFQKVALVAERVGMGQSGYRTVLNTGQHGGQSVDYIHAHILGGEQLSGHFS